MIDIRRDYGAVGDGVADDTLAIQAALDATHDFQVYFPPGYTYRCYQLMVGSGRRLFGWGATLLMENRHTLAWGLATRPGANSVSIYGLKMQAQQVMPVPGGGFFIGFRGDAALDILLDGCSGYNFATDWAHFGGNLQCDRVTVVRCSATGSGRNNLSVVHARNVLIANCSFLDTTGDNPGAGIDLEPNRNERIDNAAVVECYISGCSVGIYDHAGAVGAEATKHRLVGNTVLDSRRIGVITNEIDELVVEGNRIDGPPQTQPPLPAMLTIGISAGAFADGSRTKKYSICNNDISGHSRRVVLAGVMNGSIADNNLHGGKVEAAGLGTSGDLSIARNT